MTDYLASTTVELKGIKRANYSQLTKGINSQLRSWWVGCQNGRIQCFLLAPFTHTKTQQSSCLQ